MAERDHSSLQQGYDNARKQQLQREGAQARTQEIKDRSALALKKAGYTRTDDGGLVSAENSDAKVQEEQNRMLLQQLDGIKKATSASRSAQGVTDAIKTGDMNYLQKAIQADEGIAKLFPEVKVITNIDFESDGELLRAAGIDIAKIPKDKIADIRKQVFKFHDGKDWKIGALEPIMAKMNLHKTASADQLKVLNEFMALQTESDKGVTEADRSNSTSKAASSSKRADAAGTRAESSKILNTARAAEQSKLAEAKRVSAEAKKTQQENQAIKNKNDAKKQEQKYEIDKIKKTAKAEGKEVSGGISFKPTANQKNLSASKKIIQDFADANLEGDMESFYDVDLNAPENAELKRKALVLDHDMEVLTKKKMSSDNRKRLIKLRQLVSLGGDAAKIKETDVGWWDHSLQKAASFLTEDPRYLGNVKAKSAFEGFKGILRVAMIGAAQTTSEMKNFRLMLGDQTQKSTTLLVQLDNTLKRMEGEYGAISNQLGHPLRAKIHIGFGLKKLQESRQLIAESLSKFKDSKAASSHKKKGKKELISSLRGEKKPPGGKKSAEEIYQSILAKRKAK